MSGKQCSDFSGVNEGPFLCRIGGAFKGLVTYRDGRAAVIDPNAKSGELVFLSPVIGDVPKTQPLGDHLLRVVEGPHAGMIVYKDGGIARIDDAKPPTPPRDDDDPPTPPKTDCKAGCLAFFSRDGKRRLTVEGLSVDVITRMKAMQGQYIFSVPYTIAGAKADAIRLNQDLAGTEIGDCYARGGGVSFSFLQTTHNGAPISWGAEQLREIYRLLGQKDGQTSNAFFCSNQEDEDRIAINNDIAHRPSLLAAIKTLESGNHGSLDQAHSEALLTSLRAAAGEPDPKPPIPPPDHLKDLIWVGVTFFGVHIAGHIASRLIDKFWPKDPPNPPPSATGTSSERSPESANASDQNKAFWGGLAAACFVGAAALVADDVTGVGVADDPLALVAATAGAVFLGISALSGEKKRNSGV
ncbi:MAG TPA: hypothetical protein VLJ37_10050 [bacterium]|nr:hypothetical protein [bacterium]